MPIHTVLGPISPAELGPTSMHEHLLIDARVWYQQPAADQLPADDRVSLETRGSLQWNPLGSRDNLVIDNPDTVISELERWRQAGGSGVVDLTVVGLGQQAHLLPAIAAACGLNVMIGCGFYVHESHPRWLESATTDEITEWFLRELDEGVDDTGIRPALIGEIGTSAPITARERKVLQAAGQAAAVAGAAVNVHLDRRGTHALEAIELLANEGMPTERIVCSHLDERLDWGYHVAVAETGAILEYDTFGQEFYFGGIEKNPTDAERLEYVSRMVAADLHEQLVLGCDIWVKCAMVAFGGLGHEHLLKRIIPALRRVFEVPSEAIDAMLVGTPRRLLDRPAGGRA